MPWVRSRVLPFFAFEPKKSHVYNEIHFLNEPNEPTEPKPPRSPGNSWDFAILVVYDAGHRREASSSYPCHPATGPVLVFTPSESERTPAAKTAGFFLLPTYLPNQS